MTKLWDFQLVGARSIHFDFNGRALLADEMGLGKTIQALYYVHKKPSARPCIVVCPASVKWNWEREAQKHFGIRCEVLEGRSPGVQAKRNIMARRSPVVILNYDILHHWVSFLRMLDPQIVILDECHKIKNPRTPRYKASRSLCRGVPHVLALSGTPLTNRPAELWPALNILKPRLFNSFIDYAWRYTRPKRTPWGWTYNGAKHLGELHTILKETCMIRRLKRDVMKELPAIRRFVVPVKLPHMREYYEADVEFVKWMKKHYSSPRVRRAMRAQALVQAGYLLRLAARLKVPLVYDWIDNWLEESSGKLVVFTGHTPMINCLRRHYDGAVLTIDGGTPVHRRLGIVDRFNSDQRVRLIACNILAAGTGVDGLQRSSSTALFTDRLFTPGDMSQAEARLHRMGQAGSVSIYHLVAVATREVRLCEMLIEKQSVLDQVLDGAEEDASTDLDIFESVFATKLLK
jgi:SWI/SNF-related matrix-associated actin-dependent regulator 1 of chromatin subfamily A